MRLKIKAHKNQLRINDLGDRGEIIHHQQSNNHLLNWFIEQKSQKKLIKMKAKVKMKNQLFSNVNQNAFSRIVTMNKQLNLCNERELVQEHQENLTIRSKKPQPRLVQNQQLEELVKMMKKFMMMKNLAEHNQE